MKKLSPSVKLRKEVSEFIERLQDVDSPAPRGFLGHSVDLQ